MAAILCVFVLVLCSSSVRAEVNISLEEKVEKMAKQQEHLFRQQSLMEAKIKELEDSLNVCRAAKTKEKRLLTESIVEPTKVAFDAILTHDVAHASITDTTIVFDQVLTNIGNSYKNDIGVFIAPVKATEDHGSSTEEYGGEN